MDWLESLQKLVPWLAGLSTGPKIVVSTIAVAMTTLFLMLIWSPRIDSAPDQDPAVREAYSRMQRVLARITQGPDGRILVDGNPVQKRLEEYYRPFLSIANYVRAHPGDYKGAYEEIWNTGGESRTFINDTQAFEAVVSGYFKRYENAKGTLKAVPA